MTYMKQDDFTPAGGIQELSFDEIDGVNGGAAPVLALAIVALGALYVIRRAS